MKRKKLLLLSLIGIIIVVSLQFMFKSTKDDIKRSISSIYISNVFNRQTLVGEIYRPDKPLKMSNEQKPTSELSATKLKASELRDSELKNIELSNTELKKNQLKNTELTNTELRNTELRHTELRNTELRNTELRNTELRNTEQRNTEQRATEQRVSERRTTKPRNTELTTTELKTTERTNLAIRSNEFSWFGNTSKLVDALVESLKSKLTMAASKITINNINDKCQKLGIDYNETCNDTQGVCPQKHLPEDLRTRIEQLVLRDNLQISEKHRYVINNMSREISGNYDLIVVSGLSSNHFLEAQALFKQLHEVVFPALKNFTFVVYNLGLTESEVNQIRKYCRCQLLTFPFERFPPHFKNLKCFGFKPAVVRAMIERANLVLWTDSSFRVSSEITAVVEEARKLGVQQRYYDNHNPNPSHTLEQMFHYFGDSPCAHMAFNQVAGGFGIYHNELLIKRALLDPWLACGLRSACTCPVEQRKVQSCPSAHTTKKIGLCQRNDQSSMTLILAKLFRDKYRSFAVSLGKYDKRIVGSTYRYFEEIENVTRIS